MRSFISQTNTIDKNIYGVKEHLGGGRGGGWQLGQFHDMWVKYTLTNVLNIILGLIYGFCVLYFDFYEVNDILYYLEKKNYIQGVIGIFMVYVV